ncbi:hypothetical protein RHGRI_007192 [Rhododendron griersonianum]|uniref:Uncharacterized protein n=1 Tax=Rhododendron griersonianum TaxID=479676 RepID=A0AAV6KXM4_9ERIC|nr:hypothetical protein RHGRI_007192 [Rhododendron griersonianum]
MGGKCPHRKVKKRRYSHKTSRRTKFEIKDILSSVDNVTMLFMRAFRRQMRRRSRCLSMKIFLGWASITACTAIFCFFEFVSYFFDLSSRYFASVAVRDEHFKTKRHRKRVKQMMGPKPHTQLDADLAAGMGMPDNGPKLMSM